MSVLSDRDIRAALEAGTIKIDPYDPEDLQPSSVDLHLDRSFRVFRNNRYPYIDVRAPQPDLTEMLTIADDEPFILHPGEFVLGQTHEFVELPNDIVSRSKGRPSRSTRRSRRRRAGGPWGISSRATTSSTRSGAPTLVVAATEPMVGRPCREVTFSDGQRVVADADHQWVTVDKSGHGVVETARSRSEPPTRSRERSGPTAR